MADGTTPAKVGRYKKDDKIKLLQRILKRADDYLKLIKEQAA